MNGKRPKMKRCQFPNCQQQVIRGYCHKHQYQTMIVSYETRGRDTKQTEVPVLYDTGMEKNKRNV